MGLYHFVLLWSWGWGREEEGKASLGAVLAEPRFSHSLTCCAGHWLEFPMHRVGYYLVKLAIVSCAKEPHQADNPILAEGRERPSCIHFPGSQGTILPPKAQGTELGLPTATHLQCSEPHLSPSCQCLLSSKYLAPIITAPWASEPMR